jgi:tyrosyl-tRNA synthetase
MTHSNFKPVEEQLAYLKKGVAEIIPEAELKAKLDNSVKTGKPLRVYLGVDPTAPDLHLGHTVVLRKLKHFQDLGHTAIFLIGDFSAMIGDPTGQSETRPPLTREQVDANAKTYLEQVFKILDKEKTEVRYNSEWLSKMSAEEVVRLCSHYRLARMLEREDFNSRLDKGQPISVHELLYPLLTAIDAVKLQSDVELGATEQKFNLLVHREIQREYGLPGQAILTMPILVGLDGHRKMSKSLGNYVGITEAPGEMFGKIMSIPDELMWAYYALVTDKTEAEIQTMRQSLIASPSPPFPPMSNSNPIAPPPSPFPPVPNSADRGLLLQTPRATNPMDIKMDLAGEVVATFHGKEAAGRAAEHFRRIFRERLVPQEMRQFRVVRATETTFFLSEKRGDVEELKPPFAVPGGKTEKWSKILLLLGQVSSSAEAERLIKQKALEINGEVMSEPTARIDFTKKAKYEVRVGKKKFVRVIIE